MEQIFSEHWSLLHYGIVMSLTCAQMLVVYVLSDSSTPPKGLGLFTVYFMAALLGWIAFTLQQGYGLELGMDLPTAAAIINSYILFLAMGQRTGITWGRIPLGILCLLGCLALFFVDRQQMFLVHTSSVTIFFAGVGVMAAWRSWHEHNIGDAIIAFAAGLQIVAMPAAAMQGTNPDDMDTALALAFGFHSLSYVLLVVGFLASVLVEYQQHLATLATEDPLTRLLNRRGLEDAMQVSLAAAGREDLPTAAIMVDIDHFKKVNDSFGHDIGDVVLQQIAHILTMLSRGSDVVARFGGEEFLIILPNTEMTAARVLAERIRKVIAEQPIEVAGQEIPITVSLGVAGTAGKANLEVLYNEADRAMYVAKRGGRNRVASVEHKTLHMSSARR